MLPKKRGSLLLFDHLDILVQEYVRLLQLSGGVLNARLVLAAARGLIMIQKCSFIADTVIALIQTNSLVQCAAILYVFHVKFFTVNTEKSCCVFHLPRLLRISGTLVIVY